MWSHVHERRTHKKDSQKPQPHQKSSKRYRISSLGDRRVKVSEIANAWVPRLLNIYQQQVGKRIWHQFLNPFNHDPSDFEQWFVVTMDRTWFHQNTTETKHQSKQWLEAGGSVPEKQGRSQNNYRRTLLQRCDKAGCQKSQYETQLEEQKKKSFYTRTGHLLTKMRWQWED